MKVKVEIRSRMRRWLVDTEAQYKWEAEATYDGVTFMASSSLSEQDAVHQVAKELDKYWYYKRGDITSTHVLGEGLDVGW